MEKIVFLDWCQCWLKIHQRLLKWWFVSAETDLLKQRLIGLFFQGADHLTVTWKVDEGVYQHVDVREEGKENAFSLGRSLWIDSEVGTKMDL